MKKFIRKSKTSYINIISLMLSLCMAFNFMQVFPSTLDIFAEDTEEIIYGDVNNDTNINIFDVISLKNALLYNEQVSIDTADVNGDNMINAQDLLVLKEFLLGKIDIFPITLTIDSDNDGLCDYIEEYITLTNILLSDTDRDGLSDYDEVYLCNTDPLIKDTNNTGLIDAKKDMDNDGLSNLEELELKTDPLNEDTDGDGLSDYDEKYKYFTDPLSSDSDGDGLLDGQEIIMNLNLLSIKTNSVDDCDYIFEQDVLLNNGKLKTINESSRDFQISLKIKTNGYVENVFDISHSNMDSFFTQDYIVENSLIDIKYLENYNIEYNEIQYYILDDSIDNFAIFKYFENTNMLLPVETQYDYDNNIISFKETNTSFDSTYCIVNLDIFTNVAISKNTFQFNSVGSELTSSQDLEVFFLINTYYAEDVLDIYKDEIIKSAKQIFDKSPNSNIYISQINSEVDAPCTTIAEVLNKLNQIETTTNLGYQGENQDEDYSNAVDGFSNKIIEKISKDSSVYCFILTYGNNDNQISSTQDGFYTDLNNLKQYMINTSMITNLGDNINLVETVMGTFIADTYGIHIANIENSNKFVVSHIYNDYNFNLDFKITYYTNLGNMNLNSLSMSYKDLFNAYKNKDQLSIDFSIYPDGDNDGVPDFAEINMDLISFDNDGEIILPSFENCCYYSNNSSGYEWFKEQLNSLYGEDFFKNNMLAIVPTLSNPVLADSDGDGLLDTNDPYPNEKFNQSFQISSSYDMIPMNNWLEERCHNSQSCYNIKSATLYNNFYNLVCNVGQIMTSPSANTALMYGLFFTPDGLNSDITSNTFNGSAPNASKALKHFINNTGEDYWLSSKEISEAISVNPNNIVHLIYNINQLMQTVEETTSKNNPNIILSSSPNANFIGICNSCNDSVGIYKEEDVCSLRNSGYFDYYHRTSGYYDTTEQIDWYITIGNAKCGMVAKATNNNNVYTMNYKYYVLDIYEWAYHYDNSMKNLHDLHECGLCQEYKIYGYIEGTIQWYKGQDVTINSSLLEQVLNTLVANKVFIKGLR